MNDAVREALTAPPAAGGATETIEMPDAALVRCPLVEFNLRRVVKNCPACPHFHGATDRFPGRNGIPPEKRYLVLCGEPAPVKREIFKVVD
jgi:hypothetical protein